MFRAIWFFIQIVIAGLAAAWLATRPGFISLEGMGYTLNARAGLFLLAFVLLLVAGFFMLRFVRLVFSLPARIAGMGKAGGQRRGFRAVTRGFAAIAAGDARKAASCAKDARSLLPADFALTRLLEAQAARLAGDEAGAQHHFQMLMEDPDAAFFGVRGLLTHAIDTGDNTAALGYARKAMALNPAQGWILQTVYTLEIREKKWNEAQQTLKRLHKNNVIDAQTALRDDIALSILMAGDDQKNGREWLSSWRLEAARKKDPGFAPLALLMASLALEKGKTGKAASLVEKAWKSSPHPDLAAMWRTLAPAPKRDKPGARMKWFERLVALRPDSAEGHLAAAEGAISERLWGPARTHLAAAEALAPSPRLYRLRARLEDESGGSEADIRTWLEKAAMAKPEPLWSCRETGRIYERWSPIAEPHGSFNTIVWGHPYSSAPPFISRGKGADPLMIEAA